MKCWASSRGDCAGRQSGEHIVSAGIYDGPTVFVRGYPWCRTVKEIGLDRATAKILCEHHNNTLSPVDDAGIAAFDTLQEMFRLQDVRRRHKPSTGRWTLVESEIDGLGFERWLLKTTINAVCAAPGEQR